MPRQTRATLKNYFEEGSLPTQDHFADLIDSTLNMVDEGFSRTDRDGLRLRTPVQEHTLLSFYRGQGGDTPLWSAGFGEGGSQFVLRAGDATAPPLLVLDPAAGLGVGTQAPRCTVDVAGTVGARGRLGAAPAVETAIVADGRWHDIAVDLHGCQAFEVMAGAGHPDDAGRFALLRAIAMNTHNPAWWDDLLGRKKGIRAQHAYYSRRCDRLQLRWAGEHGKGARYRLEIRSLCDYLGHRRSRDKPLPPEQEVRIHVYLTQLWFQPEMQPGLTP
jgi:hypothetical protein